MDLWWGHIGAAALFDWTQNPDVLALLASGTYWHYSQAGCVCHGTGPLLLLND